MTKRWEKRDRPVVMSSPRPSAKAASSGSAPWVLNGRTTIQGASARPGPESGRRSAAFGFAVGRRGGEVALRRRSQPSRAALTSRAEAESLPGSFARQRSTIALGGPRAARLRLAPADAGCPAGWPTSGPRRCPPGTAGVPSPSRRGSRPARRCRSGGPPVAPAPARATCRAPSPSRCPRASAASVDSSEPAGAPSSAGATLAQAEVQDLHASAPRHHDVRGLEVAVDDALLVSGGEGIGEGRWRSRGSARRAARLRGSAGRGAGPRRAAWSGSGRRRASSTEKTVTMPGWSRAASAFASRRKRSSRSGLAAISAGSTLSATSRPSFVSVAR